MDGESSSSAPDNSPTRNTSNTSEHELVAFDNSSNNRKENDLRQVELQHIGGQNHQDFATLEQQQNHQALLRQQVTGTGPAVVQHSTKKRTKKRQDSMDDHQSRLRQQAVLRAAENASAGVHPPNDNANDAERTRSIADVSSSNSLSRNNNSNAAATATSISSSQAAFVPVVQRHQDEPLVHDNARDNNSYYEEQRRELSYQHQRAAPELCTPSPRNTPSAWSVVPSSVGCPCERSLCSACVWNDDLYLFGGYNGQSRVNDFHRYHFESQCWTLIPAVGQVPSARDRHVSVVCGNTFYVFGGFDGSARTNDFYGFDFSTMTWNPVEQRSPPPSERHSHSAVVHEHCMYVYGGYDGSYKSDLHQFDFLSQQWTAINTGGRHPRARYRATTVVSNSQMILFGGHDGTRHLNDIHVLDLDSLQWSAPAVENPPIPRDSHVSCIYNGSVYVFGGSSGSAMNDLHELPLTTTSPASSALKWKPVKICGSNSTNTAGATADSVTSTGSSEASLLCPRQRFCHVAVVHQDAMYVFGGYDGQERLDDFWRFDFAQRDEIPPSSLLNDLQAMVNDDTCSDVIFVVENGTKEVYAHKVMLLRCSYFRALLLGGMVESRLNKIPLPELRYEILLQVLEYLYTDNIHFSRNGCNDLESAMELFQAADLFMIYRLQKICERHILQNLNVENAATLFHYASDVVVGASNLREKSLSFILAHFEAVSKTTAFEEMGRANMELVFEVLRNR